MYNCLLSVSYTAQRITNKWVFVDKDNQYKRRKIAASPVALASENDIC
jgi:hypothetical protein